VREGNQALDRGDTVAVGAALASVTAMLGVLGLDPAAPEWASESATDDLTPVVDRLVATVLSQREQARARKDWASADAIRDALKDAGLTIEDTKDGARWSLGKA
jgi:cysteinyl-tRNA synthetase